MSDDVKWPSADTVARIVVAAAREFDETPTIVLTSFSSRARGIAYLAIIDRLHPKLSPARVAAMLGARDPKSYSNNWRKGGTNRAPKWFNESLVDKVIERAKKIPSDDPDPDPEPIVVPRITMIKAPLPAGVRDTPRVRERVHREIFGDASGVDLNYRPDAPAERRGAILHTAELMGDPPPGRSALAQRENPELGKASDDDDDNEV